MRPGHSFASHRASILLVVLLVLAAGCSWVFANVLVETGGQVPFYARLAHNEIYGDGEQVGIVFYRPPDCVRPDFNMLDLFDWASVWGCQPPTTDGFEVWKNGPDVDVAPIQAVLHGLGAVPVWFVDQDELEAAISDGVLTIGELASLPSLERGEAWLYQEVLHPLEGAVRDHLEFNARGYLEDGRAFRLHVQQNEAKVVVRIRIR